MTSEQVEFDAASAAYWWLTQNHSGQGSQAYEVLSRLLTVYTPCSADERGELTDDAYRILILTKALANIASTSSAAINQLLRNLFPGRGKAYVEDLGGMAMRFVFDFALTPVEYAIVSQSGALPHPAGVALSVSVPP